MDSILSFYCILNETTHRQTDNTPNNYIRYNITRDAHIHTSAYIYNIERSRTYKIGITNTRSIIARIYNHRSHMQTTHKINEYNSKIFNMLIDREKERQKKKTINNSISCLSLVYLFPYRKKQASKRIGKLKTKDSMPVLI